MKGPTRNAAAAGLMLLSAIVLGALIGLGIGTLAGAPGLVATLGGFVGLLAGFALVYTIFRDI